MKFQSKVLGKGEVSVCEKNGIRLHAYKTNDPIDDEVFVVEKDGKGFVIEYPCFFDNIAELESYISDEGIEIEGILAAYHMAGATFLQGTPVLATAEADEYGHNGGGKALIDGFIEAFGDAFDGSIPDVTRTIEGGDMQIAGIDVRILPNNDAFDVVVPGLNMIYTHMLGHDCHSIVAGPAHADAIIAQLEGYIEAGYDCVLTSHYTPEDLKDVRTKIDYLVRLNELAAQSYNAEEFKAAMEKEFPAYAGQNYLDMTVGFFFGQQ